MAKPTHHSALEGMGFRLYDEYFNGSGDRSGVATTRHYIAYNNTPSGKSVIRPLIHHVYVDEFSGNPGKYNVSYGITQDGQPYADGAFSTVRNHKSNVVKGTSDPIADIMSYHRGVVNGLKGKQDPPLTEVTPGNIQQINPQRPYHITPRGEDDPGMKRMRFITPGPEPQRMIYHNSAEDQPLDLEIYRRLTSGSRGVSPFSYQGRFPGDSGTDVYQVTHGDPESPDTFGYSFTVRHRPDATHPFSYSAIRHQTGTDDEGGQDQGSFLDVTGNAEPVANFGTVNQLVRRHNQMLNVLGITLKASRMKTSSDEFDEILRANNYSGSCAMCGKAVRDIPESSFRDDKLYQVNPEDETSDMHGPPVNLCGSCTQNPDVTTAIRKNPKGFGWHWNDQGVPGCPQCEAHLMDQADEDLRP